MSKNKETDLNEEIVDAGVIEGEAAEAYFHEGSMVQATIRRRRVDALLDGLDYLPPGDPNGSALLDELARKLEELDMLDEAGGLLQSSEATLRPRADCSIYFLGLNPGGDAGVDYSVLDKGQTVYESLALARLGVCGWDQNWSRKDATYPPGQSPLQRRFKHIARFLGLSYPEILATNLIFTRSRSFKALSNAKDLLDACLPIHQMMIDAVQPERLWVMGNVNHAGAALSLHNVEWRSAKHNDWLIGHGEAEFCGQVGSPGTELEFAL